MDVTNTMSAQFVGSLLISVIMAFAFMYWQWHEFQSNIRALKKLGSFFSKNDEYATSEVQIYNGYKMTTNILIKDVAGEDSELKNLIGDINAYIGKSKGTVAFSIIQNKTERRISMLYEMATSKLSFPTHIGLMGTFAGVFLGLVMFLVGTLFSGEITDSTIQSLITGILVSMITSFFGILLLILSHKEASAVSSQVDVDKNEFYEWIQNELMPSVDVTMVEAIGKLHETIDKLEPSFSGVISEFKDAFRDVTGAFGTDFRESVKVVSSAVKRMGENMDKVNRNIKLQDDLLDTIRSRELIKGMDAFAEASHKFSEITGSLDQFERARRLMLIAAQETINIQKSFNESLDVPKKVAAEINMILNRITTFEENINKLGTELSGMQTFADSVVKQIQGNINAINAKHGIAKDFIAVADEDLEKYFDEHKQKLGLIAKHYNEALESYLADYEAMLVERKEELKQRKREFTDAIDQKLSIEDIRSEFTALKKLNTIAEKVDQLAHNSVTGDKLNKALEGIRLELDAMIVAQEKQSKGFISSFSGSSAATERMIQARDKAVQEAETAKQNEVAAKQQVELLKQELGDLNQKFNQLNGYVESLTRNRTTQQTYVSLHPVVTSQVSTNTAATDSSMQMTATKSPESTKPIEVDKQQIGSSDEDPSINIETTEVEEPKKKRSFWSKLFHKK